MKSNLKLFFLLTLFGTFAQSINAQDGYREKIYIEVDYYFDELDYAFYQTFNAFLSGHDGWASARLRKAAALVKLEANNAKVHNKKPILAQAKRLELLADSIAYGKVNGTWRLKRAYSRTHYVLANDYKLRAAAFWADKKTEEAGNAMIAAAGYLGHAAKWSGTKLESGVVKGGKAIGKGAETAAVGSYRGVRWLGSKMVRGVAFVPSKVGEGLEWVGKGLDKVGKDIEPKKKDKK